MHTPRLVPDRLTEPTWRVDARCRQKNAGFFFAPPHQENKAEKSERESAARSLCAVCTVRTECLDYALTVQEPHGIWGGMNETERRRVLRTRGQAPVAGRAVPTRPGR